MTKWHEFRLELGVREVANGPDLTETKQQHYMLMYHNGLTNEEVYDDPIILFQAASFILNNWNNGTREIVKNLQKDRKNQGAIIIDQQGKA